MSNISKKNVTLKERENTVRKWHQQLLKESQSSDSFYEDRWNELVIEYMDDLEDDEMFERFYEEFKNLLEHPGQHY